ncbi:hypothetical protein [Aeromonas sp. Y318-3]|uniref:hypothetical protein n=1 Tax=Aeromonas sp. Y318-3 TaxID=2990509 RepID=UPI0022E626F0|nr:hypothetical protein [Aeromonas sp. Y318-3]
MDYKQHIADLRARYNSLLAAIKQPDLYGIIESLEALGMTPADLPLDEPVWPSRAIPLRRAIEALMIEADMEADKLEKELVSLPPKPSKKPSLISVPDSAKVLSDGIKQINAKNDKMIADTLARRSSLAPVTALAEPQTEVTVTKRKAPTKKPKQEALATVTETIQESQPVEPVELVTVTQVEPQPEQAKPKRPRGRPTLGDRPMTSAEKQAAYRARHKMKKVTVTFDRSDADELLTYLTAVASGITFPLDKQLATRLRDACQSAWVGQLVSDATSSTDA